MSYDQPAKAQILPEQESIVFTPGTYRPGYSRVTIFVRFQFILLLTSFLDTHKYILHQIIFVIQIQDILELGVQNFLCILEKLLINHM